MTDPDSDDLGSISHAIRKLGADEEAVQKLWDRFFQRLCAYSKTRLYNRHNSVVDEEEVAARAFFALYQGITNGRLTRVRNRNELWKVLTVLAANKASSLRRHYDTQKRGGGRVHQDSIFGSAGADGIIDFLQRELNPAEHAEFANALSELIRQLPDEGYRRIVLMRLGGHTHEEIAGELNCAVRTIDRKMKHIREIWNRLDGAPP